jgi:hypothetical protein
VPRHRKRKGRAQPPAADHYAARAVVRLRAAHNLPSECSPDDAIRAGLCCEADWIDALDAEREIFWSQNGVKARLNVLARHPVEAAKARAAQERR